MPSKLARLALPLALTGCVTGYFPPAVNAPLLTRRGETQVAGHLQLNGSTELSAPSFQLQVAHALTENFGLLADVSGHDAEESSHLAGDLGLAFYFARQGVRAMGILGVGGGRGDDAGIEKGEFSSAHVRYRGKYLSCFIQPTVGGAGRYAEIGVATRTGVMRYWYDQYVQDVVPRDEARAQDFSIPPGTAKTLIFLEPFGFVRVGGESLKVEFQTGASAAAPRKDKGGFWSLFASLGLRAKFGGGN